MTTWTVEAKFDGSTWTDITEWCEDIRTRRGRSTDLDVVEAGVCQILLWNQDGRFTPENTQGSYVSGGASQILPGVAVRLRTVAGTSSDTRGLFVGEADRWEPLWDADGNAFVQVDVIDGFEKLRRVEIDYAASGQILAGSPDGYWQLLKERQGQSDYDMFLESGTTTDDGATIVSGGAGALTVVADASEAGGATTVKGDPTWAGTANDVTFGAWIEWDEGTDPWFRIAELIQGPRDGVIGGSSAPGAGWRFAVSSPDGRLRLDVADWDGTITTIDVLGGDALSWAKDTRYHVGFWWDQSAGQVTFYRNGTSAGTDTTAVTPGFASATASKLRVGRPQSTTGTWRISDVALWTSDQSALVSDVADAGDGFASDLSGARIGRLLDWAGWPSVDRAVDTGTTSLAGIDANTTVLAACQDAAAADNGLFFITKDGFARFAGRRERWEGSYSDTYSDTYTDDGGIRATFDDDGTDTPYEQIGWRYDTTLLHNAVTVDSNTQGVSDGYAEDATSVGVYGRRTLTISTISNSTTDNAERAQWEVSRRKGPHLRLELLASSSLDEDEQEAAAGLELGDLVEVSRRPGASQDDITVDLRVASIAHHIGGGGLAWSVDFGLTEAETDQPGTYDAAVYGTDYYGY